MDRSIQAEGTFGIMKYDRWYKRIVRRGPDSVRLELFLVSIGHNPYKYHNNRMRLRELHKHRNAVLTGEGVTIPYSHVECENVFKNEVAVKPGIFQLHFFTASIFTKSSQKMLALILDEC